jgi:uncharacterized Tic20 family protein
MLKSSQLGHHCYNIKRKIMVGSLLILKYLIAIKTISFILKFLLFLTVLCYVLINSAMALSIVDLIVIPINDSQNNEFQHIVMPSFAFSLLCRVPL